MSDRNFNRHIEMTPSVCGGKPRIAGHRITVHDVVIWAERLGRSPDEIACEYDLSLADVYSALAHYFDHREEIDRAIEESSTFVTALREKTPSKLRRKMEMHPSRGASDN